MSISYVALSLLKTSDEMNTLPRDEPMSHFRSLRVYEDIFVKVKSWSTFERSDIDRNRIQVAMILPDFVKTFERKLVRKPRLYSSVLFPRFLHLRLDFDGPV